MRSDIKRRLARLEITAPADERSGRLVDFAVFALALYSGALDEADAISDAYARALGYGRAPALYAALEADPGRVASKHIEALQRLFPTLSSTADERTQLGSLQRLLSDVSPPLINRLNVSTMTDAELLDLERLLVACRDAFVGPGWC
jgi:hypothetical protein